MMLVHNLKEHNNQTQGIEENNQQGPTRNNKTASYTIYKNYKQINKTTSLE